MMYFARCVIVVNPATRRGLIHQARYLAAQFSEHVGWDEGASSAPGKPGGLFTATNGWAWRYGKKAEGIEMPGVQDLLLYPLDTGEDPSCPRCGAVMLLAGAELNNDQVKVVTFRCDQCGRSERFIVDEDWLSPPDARPHASSVQHIAGG
jgi:hypothetical protein